MKIIHKTLEFKESDDPEEIVELTAIYETPKEDDSLIDPYDIQGVWLPYHREEQYSTYLKCYIWISDGHAIESWNCIKDFPSSVLMSNGNYSRYWMLPPDESFIGWELDESKKPLPPTLEIPTQTCKLIDIEI